VRETQEKQKHRAIRGIEKIKTRVGSLRYSTCSRIAYPVPPDQQHIIIPSAFSDTLCKWIVERHSRFPTKPDFRAWIIIMWNRKWATDRWKLTTGQRRFCICTCIGWDRNFDGPGVAYI